MKDALIKVLSWVNTPTVCNAIELAQGKRGFSNFTKSTVICTSTEQLPLLGFARTARIASRFPANETAKDARNRQMDYYRYVSDSPKLSVMVVEDIDGPNGHGAFWNEINARVHKKLGVSGALTNGAVRDLDVLPQSFPILAGSIGPSQGHVHIINTGRPVTVFGLTVSEGDFIHADRHGAVIIPPDILPVIDRAITDLIQIEGDIIGRISKDDFTIEDLENDWNSFETSPV